MTNASTLEVIQPLITTQVIAKEEPIFKGQFAYAYRRNYESMRFPSEIRTKLQEANYRWFIKAGSLLKLKCAASVGAPSGRDWGFIPVWRYMHLTSHGPVVGVRLPCEYGGKVPEWVRPRIKQVKALGIKCFTIHSNEKLDIKLKDPVLVGWAGMTIIFFQDSLDEVSISHEGYESIEGIVVALWNRDKEVNVVA